MEDSVTAFRVIQLEVSEASPLSEEVVTWIEEWWEVELRSEVADCEHNACRLCQREQQIAHTRVMSVLTGVSVVALED